MFGEISFLLDCPATVNIIAESEEVEVTILEISFVNALLITKPSTTPKFYRYLAATLLNRMQFFQQRNRLQFTISNKTSASLSTSPALSVNDNGGSENYSEVVAIEQDVK